jgi:ADP-ribose pyrophosphatase
MSEPIERLGETSLYRGRIVDLWLERVRLPNGAACELEIVRHRGAAAAVPVDAEGRVALVRQYRHAVGAWLLEVPAGKLDAGEAPQTCALREVEEETGMRPGRLVPLGWIWTTPGFTNERIWLYAAFDLTASEQTLEPDEALSVERLPVAEAVRRAAAGEIEDAKSVCALLRLATVLP